MNTFSNLFKQMMGSQVQSSENQDPQPKLYPKIVALPSSHPMVTSIMKYDSQGDAMESHYHHLPVDPSPHIAITPANRQLQSTYSSLFQSDYYHCATNGSALCDVPQSQFLNHFSVPDNSFAESFGSSSEASFMFSPPQPTTDPGLSFLDNAMAGSFQDFMAAAELSAHTSTPTDFVIEDVFKMDDEEQNLSGQLIAPGSFGLPMYMQASNSLPAKPVETLVTTNGSMTSSSPSLDDSSCLSPVSPVFSDLGNSTSTYSSPNQPFLSPIESSQSLDVPTGYSLTRTPSGGRARKPPSDLILITGPNGERRYQCNQCSHTSTRPNNLREHQLRHDPNRPKRFRCILCQRPFARKNDLKRHWQIHFKGESSSVPQYKTLLMVMLNKSLSYSTDT